MMGLVEYASGRVNIAKSASFFGFDQNKVDANTPYRAYANNGIEDIRMGYMVENCLTAVPMRPYELPMLGGCVFYFAANYDPGSLKIIAAISPILRDSERKF